MFVLCRYIAWFTLVTNNMEAPDVSQFLRLGYGAVLERARDRLHEDHVNLSRMPKHDRAISPAG